MIKPKKTVQEMAPYYPPTSNRSNFIRLDFNENTIGCSPKVIEALKSVTANELCMYPDYQELRKLIADFNKVDILNIIPTNAGDEAIMLVMNTFIDKGDTILLPSPTFAMFKFYAQLNGANIKKIQYNDDFSFPINQLLNSITDEVRLIVLVNPNNPTGTSIDKKDIIKILDKAKKSIVLLDEAYYDFTQETCIELIETYPNLVILRSFSKAFGLGGLRLGYLISNKNNIEIFQKVNSPYSITSLATRIIKAALEDYDFVQDYVSEIKTNKEYLYQEFTRLNIKYYTGSANFFLADFGKNYKDVFNGLKENNILLRDRNSYVRNCLRITVGTKKQCELLIKFLERILLKLREYDTLLFDMDGVLVDVSRSYRLAVKKTVEFFLEDKKISFEQIQSFKEKSGNNNDWDCTKNILENNGVIKTRDEIRKKFDSIYFDGVIDNEILIVDKTQLENLSKNYKLGLITGRPRKDADYTINKFGLDKFFKLILTMDDESDKTKGMQESMKKFNSKRAVYIGDTVDDIISSKKAGIDSIGILTSSSSSKTKDKLKKQGAKIVLESVNKLREVL